MNKLYAKVGEMNYDGLFSDVVPTHQERTGVIAHGEVSADFKRGSVLEKGADGKLYILGTNPNAAVTEDFNGDGTTTTFTITAAVKPLAIKGVKVGTEAVSVASYNAQTGIVTMASAPAAGTANVHITYDNAAANTPDCVLCDDVTVGAEADEIVAVYIAGCFNTGKITVKDGYTMTEADLDALRCRGIVFKAASNV